MVEIVVVDNSVLMPLVYRDEDDTGSRRLILAGASSVKLLCPALCMIEFGNGILNGVKRNPQRISKAAASLAFAELANLPLQFRDSIGTSSLSKIGDSAMRLGLSFYDAVYLELAISENAKLATLDQPLAKAALVAGVPLWDWG
jgi:predicted nucleic acid-binding protein